MYTRDGPVVWCEDAGQVPVQGCPLIWIIVAHGPTVLAVGAGGDCLDIFSRIYHFSSFSLSLEDNIQYRLKYCLKRLLNPNQL